MILVSNKDEDFYTWYSSRTPKRMRNTDEDKNKRLKRKRLREKRKRKEAERSYFETLIDSSLPIVKIVMKDEVICPGVIIHEYFVLASAQCVSKMTGLYIHSGNNMSIYQVYLYSQQPFALIQTLSRLPYQEICFNNQGSY